MSKNQVLKFGFTVIELLVVIAVIGLLGGVILTKSKETRSADRDFSRSQKLSTIKDKLEDYHNDKGGYPDGEFTAEQLGISDENVLKGSNNTIIKRTFSTETKEPDVKVSASEQFAYAAYGCQKKEATTPVASSCTKYVLKGYMERAGEFKKLSNN